MPVAAAGNERRPLFEGNRCRPMKASPRWVCQGNTTPSGERAPAPSTCHV